MAIVDVERAFEVFAWYRPVVIRTGTTEKPDLDVLHDAEWHLELPGTCSATHFRRMMLEKIGTFPIDPACVQHVFPGVRPGDSQAVSDIAIANRMKVWEPGRPRVSLRRF